MPEEISDLLKREKYISMPDPAGGIYLARVDDGSDFLEGIRKGIVGRKRHVIQPSLESVAGQEDETLFLRRVRKERSRAYPADEGVNLGEIKNIDDKYCVVITERSLDNPFVVDPALIKAIKAHTRPAGTDYDKAKAIFDWFEENISYGDRRRERHGYRNSEEVLSAKEGVCGEMAYLYVAMARCVGLKSNFVRVERDFENKKVLHACASVEIDGRRMMLVDPAYHMFDARHRKISIMSDDETIATFKQMRYQKN